MSVFDDDDSTPAGYIEGIGATIAEGRSTTDEAARQLYEQGVAQYGKGRVDDFLARNPGDYARIGSALYESPQAAPAPAAVESSGGGGGSSYGGAPDSIRPFNDTFTAPTMEQVQGGEPFKFRLGEAVNAISRGGLGRGTFFTNQTAKALQEQASSIASDEYGKAYDRSFGEYLTKADIFDRNETNRFGSQRTNRMDDFGIFDSNRNFGLAEKTADRSYSLADRGLTFDQNRATTGDAWNRGVDVWNMNRTSGQDEFGNAVTIADLINRYRPRPS